LSDGTAVVWDLRKIETPVRTFACAADHSSTASPASVAYGVDGTFLALSGTNLQVYDSSVAVSSEVPLITLATRQPVRGVFWGPSYVAASFLL